MNRSPKSTTFFFVGLAAAVTVELSLGLLLYASAGFLPALTLVLTAEIGAFAVGLATTPRSPEASRTWRWLACAGSLFVAGVAALVWNVVDQVPAGLPGGVTVLLFGALPMYALGLVFAGLAERAGRRSIGPAAAFGAAVGVALTGLLLLPRLTPVSIYMFALLCIATAAILEGPREDEEAEPEEAEASPGEERIPSIAEFAPDPPGDWDRVPPITAFAPDSFGDQERIPSIAEFAPDGPWPDPMDMPPPGVWTGTDTPGDG